MHRAEAVLVLVHAVEHLLQADRLGIVHRAAAPAREAVARGPDDVDVGGAHHDAFLENLEALVDERIEATLDDLFLGVRNLRDLQFAGALAQDFDRFRIVVALPVALLVFVEALAGLLAVAAVFAERDFRLIIGRVDRVLVGIGLVHVDADVDAGHVVDGEQAHGHAPLFHGRVDLARRRAFHHHALGLAAVGLHHAVADKTVADFYQHRRLLERLGEFDRRADRLRARLRRADDLEQRHDIGRREEVQADHVLRTLGGRADLFHVERRGVGRQHAAGLGHLVELGEDLLLQLHVLEHGFDDHVGFGEIGVIGRALDEAHALGLVLRREAAALDHRVIGAFEHAQAPLQSLVAGVEHRNRDAGVGEADGDAAAHCARADNAGLGDRAGLGVGGNVGDLAGRALREEDVDRALALGRQLRLVAELFLDQQALVERLFGRCADRLDRGLRGDAVRVKLLGGRFGGGEDFRRRGFRRDIHLAGAARALAGGDQLPGVFDSRCIHVAVGDAVDRAIFERRLGVDHLGGDDHLQRLLGADQAGKALRAAGAGDDPEIDFREADARAGVGDAIVAGERDLVAAAERGAEQRGHDRHVLVLETGEEMAVFGFLRRAGKFADVGAGEEGRALAGEHDRLDARELLDLVERGFQPRTHGCGYGVDRRGVHRDHGHAVLEIHVIDLVRHGCLPAAHRRLLIARPAVAGRPGGCIAHFVMRHNYFFDPNPPL